MYCPKCGLQNTDATKFCRSCGGVLSGVMATVEGKPTGSKFSLEERSVILYSRGVRGVLTSVAFLVITGLMFAFGGDLKLYWLIPVAAAMVILAGSIARFVQASGYKKIAEKGQRPAELTAGQAGFLDPPPRTFYDTDGLADKPFSVTERTTNLLRRMDNDE